MHKFALKYCDILKANNIPFKIVDCHDSDFLNQVKQADLFIYFLGQSPMHLQQQKVLINIVDKILNIPCFPDWNTSWHFDDKIAEYYLLHSNDFPIAESWIFWDKEQAINWAKKVEYPVIFKLKGGAGSLNVVKVDSQDMAFKLINKMFSSGIPSGRIPHANLHSTYNKNYKRMLKNELKYSLYKLGIRYGQTENYERQRRYVFFQKFLPNNNYDTRVTVIGNKIFAFRRMNRPNDFRSSGGGNIDSSPEKIDLKVLSIAYQISQTLGFQTMAYDFLKNEEGNPIINEISCQFADWAIYDCPGYWDESLNWHEGHYWPQYIQLQYLLKNENLVSPEFIIDKDPNKLVKY